MTGRVIAVVFLLLGTACAQIESGSSEVARRVRVRIAFSDHAPCDSSTRVVLTGAMGFALAEGSVNGECTAYSGVEAVQQVAEDANTECFG